MLSFRVHRFVALSLASIFMLVQSAAPWLHQGCQHDHSTHSHVAHVHASHCHQQGAEGTQHSDACHDHCHGSSVKSCQSGIADSGLTVQHTHSHDVLQHDCAACRLLALSSLPAELAASPLGQPVSSSDAVILPRTTLAVLALAYLSRGPPCMA